MLVSHAGINCWYHILVSYAGMHLGVIADNQECLGDMLHGDASL